MTISMTATELKAKILSVLDKVATGEVVEVTKRGVPIARLVPLKDSDNLEGMFVGIASSSSKNDEDLYSGDEMWNAS